MKPYHFFTALILFSLLGGCASNSKKIDSRPSYYFDLKSYFDGEAKRLNTTNLYIEKSVSKNKEKESKRVRIKDWATEFALFSNSDINKTAWKDSYRKDSTDSQISYIAKYPNLKTQSIEIDFTNHKLHAIKIVNHQKNYLYESKETLVYFPDSLYTINKEQKLFLKDDDIYTIEGNFKK
jgi:hypothetical protein